MPVALKAIKDDNLNPSEEIVRKFNLTITQVTMLLYSRQFLFLDLESMRLIG